jgi:hypothetical protein
VESDEYRGPRTIERRGRGMGGWIWVAPGVPPSTSDQLLEPDSATHDTHDGLAIGDVDTPPETAIDGAQTIDPRTPDAPDSPLIRIEVVGPVGVDPELPPPKRSVVLELACHLALHRRRLVTTEELQTALSGDDGDGPETSAKSVRTYMSELRRWLGADYVPSARGSGYRFSESVTSDWDEFRSFAQVKAEDPYDQIRALSQALNLVRGRPFEGMNYKWVDAELLVSEMEVAISDVARRLGAIGVELGEPAIVYFAGRRAALACPYDIGLWEMALQGGAGYDATELAKTWHDAQVALGDESAALGDLAKRLGLA